MGSARDLSVVGLVLVAGCGKVTQNQPDGAVPIDGRQVDALVPDASIDAPPPDPIVNGSFESGDYTGWTLNQDAAQIGLWGIGNNGDQLDGTNPLHDFDSGTDFAVGCFSASLPPPLQASDGTKVAYNGQNGAARHRIWQDITVPVGLSTLSWSMGYVNLAGAFDTTVQFAAVEVRDPTTDAITQTLYTTDPAAAPPQTLAMTPFIADISAYQGQTIRITVDLQIQNNCMFAEFDGFALH